MKQKKQGLLWRIQAPNKEYASYVFGTMHVKNDRFFKNLAPVYQAIEETQTYAAEYDLNESKTNFDPSIIQLAKDTTLQDYMSKKQYQKLQKIILKAFQINLDQLQSLLPFFVINLITQQILTQNTNVSLDEYLWNYAEDNQKNCTGVEQFSEQLLILQEMKMETQINMLLKLGKHVNKYRKQLITSSELYQSQDIQKLYQFTKKSTGVMRKRLIYQRNQIMANRIAELNEESSLFAAIGAAHLAGGKGVLRYLKQKGFLLQPIAMDNRK